MQRRNILCAAEKITSSQENKLEAMRGLLRSQYQLQKWTEAADNAKELTERKRKQLQMINHLPIWRLPNRTR